MGTDSLQDYVSRLRRVVEDLNAEKQCQGDTIRALKAEARSYQDELNRLTISSQNELVQLEVWYQKELRRMKLAHDEELSRRKVSYNDDRANDDMARMTLSVEEELGRARKVTAKLEAQKVEHRDEIRALKSEARSYLEELAQMRKELAKVEADRVRLQVKIDALVVEATSHESELARMRNELRKVEADKLRQEERFEVELVQMREEAEKLRVEASQEMPARNIGREVRLRYLEKHRQRMGRRIGNEGHQRIKCGDRAAHRGRPVVDAMLYVTGLAQDRDVYPELYGVEPEIMRKWVDVPELIEVAGFRASLQSEGRLTEEFRTPFEKMLDIATSYLSPTDLKAAFGENKVLQQLHGQLQQCYDKIVAANPRCKSFA